MLALTNIAAMLAPGGVFLHNEARPSMGAMTSALGLPFEQSRHVVIATVRGAPAPLFDSVWLHRKVRDSALATCSNAPWFTRNGPSREITTNTMTRWPR